MQTTSAAAAPRSAPSQRKTWLTLMARSQAVRRSWSRLTPMLSSARTSSSTFPTWPRSITSTWCKVRTLPTQIQPPRSSIAVSSIIIFTECAAVAAGPAVHKHQYSSHAVTDINLDNVCKKGNTLLWDLVQDEDAVRLQHQFYSVLSLQIFSQSCLNKLNQL